MRRAVTGCLLALILIVAPACGGGSGSTSTAGIRFVQASIDAPWVNFYIDGTNKYSNLLYGNATGYLSVKPGSRHVQAFPVNSTTPLLDEKLSLAASANETVVLSGPVAHAQTFVLDDGSTTTGGTSTTGSLRVVDLSSQMGPADLYIVASGTNLTGATPVATNMVFGQNTGYQSLTAGTGGSDYTVYLTVPTTHSVYLTTGPVTVTGSKKQTVFILDAPAGGLTFTLLSDQ